MRSDVLRTLALRLFFDFLETLGKEKTGTALIDYITHKAKFDKGAQVSIIRQSTYFELVLQCDLREKNICDLSITKSYYFLEFRPAAKGKSTPGVLKNTFAQNAIGY